MSLSLSQIKTQMQLWSLRNLPEDSLSEMDDDEMLAIFNKVAEDFNLEGYINKERYNNDATSGETNYEMQGVIRRVLLFLYKDTNFETQRYTFVNDVIVLKNAPDGTPELDIHYLRACESMADATDEVDLPDQLLLDYMDLVKKKFEVEYGDAEEILYTQYLKQKAGNARKGQQLKPIHPGVMRVWGDWDTGDDVYDITDQWVSQDSVTADVDGNYFFIS